MEEFNKFPTNKKDELSQRNNLSYYLDYTLGESRKLKFDHIITLSAATIYLLLSQDQTSRRRRAPPPSTARVTNTVNIPGIRITAEFALLNSRLLCSCTSSPQTRGRQQQRWDQDGARKLHNRRRRRRLSQRTTTSGVAVLGNCYGRNN